MLGSWKAIKLGSYEVGLLGGVRAWSLERY